MSHEEGENEATMRRFRELQLIGIMTDASGLFGDRGVGSAVSKYASGEATALRKVSAASLKARAEIKAATTASDRSVAASKLKAGVASNALDMKTYMDAAGAPINVGTGVGGKSYTTDAEGERTGVDITGLTPYDVGRSISASDRAAAKDTATEQTQLDEMRAGLDYFNTIATSPNFHAATGSVIDLRKQFAEYTNFMPEVQVDMNRIRNITLDAIKPMLASKLFDRLSDGDRRALEATAPNETDEPMVFLEWLNDKFLPTVRQAFKDGGEAHLLPEIEAEVAAIIKRGYAVQYPKEYIRRYGEEGVNAPATGGGAPRFSDPAKQAKYEAYKLKHQGRTQ